MISGHCSQKTMKINEDFIYILRYWPKYSMLTIVDQDNGYAGLWNFIVAKLFSSFALLLPLRIRLPDFLSVSASQ